MSNNPLQYSLRTLLLVTTILAVCLAFVPRVTIVCLTVAAIGGSALAVGELAVCFHRAFSWLIATWFFVIGVCCLYIVIAIALDDDEGYTPSLKVLAVIVFGFFACFGFRGAACAYREARSNSNSFDAASRKSQEASQSGDWSDDRLP